MIEDDAIRTLVTRLSRPHGSGGEVVERAAIMAEGADYVEILAWITDHDGRPEVQEPAGAGRGLHSARLTSGVHAAAATPRRYILPPGVLS
jgi:hypothetical protein